MIDAEVSPATSVSIYALTDPDSGEVRYVGRTAHNPWKRYSEHVTGRDKSTKAWILGLRPTRQVPELKILEESISMEVAGERERYWIDYWRSQGVPLINYLAKPKPVRVARPKAVGPIGPPPRGSLLALLERYGIHTIRDLTHRTGLSRQQCWNLWHGYAGVGRETLKLFSERLPEIPIQELLQVDPIPHAQRPRRGRPRKRPADEGQA